MLSKAIKGAALLCGLSKADRYLTEMEELIMQVKRDTDGKERIPWKQSLTQKMMTSEEWTDQIKKELLIPRLGNHLSYHDSIVLIEQLKKEFPQAVTVSSFGTSFEGRDIPLITLKTGSKPISERPALLITGAHHCREAVSIQMPFYMIFKFLHGMLHNDEFYTNLLDSTTLYFVPMLNVDGVFDIE